MNKGAAPFQVYAEPFGSPNGVTKSFPLLLCGQATTRVSNLRAVYRQDWQGRRKLFPTPRTNKCYPATPTSGWGLNGGGTGGKVAQAGGYADPAGGFTAVRYTMTADGGNCGPFYNRAGVFVGGNAYKSHVWVRGVTGNEYLRVLCEGSDNTSLYIKLTTGWQRVDYNFTKLVDSGALTFYLYGAANSATPALTGHGVEIFGCNVYDAADENGATIITTTGPVTLTDYTFDGTNVVLGVPPATNNQLVWDGDVLVDIRVREQSDLARAIKGELFGPGDGVSRVLPLKVGGSVYAGVSKVDRVYCTDWQGTHRLRPYERTNQCRNATELNKWPGYYTLPDGRQVGEIGPDGAASAFSFLLNPVGNGQFAGIYDGDDWVLPWDRSAPSKFGVWLRCDVATRIFIGARTLGRGQLLCDVTTEWKFYSVDIPVNQYSAGSNRGAAVIFDSTQTGNNKTPPTARLYVAYPYLTQDDVIGRFIPTSGATPGKRVDYVQLGAAIGFREAFKGDARLSWDGEIFWPNVPSLLPPNALATERSVEGAMSRIADVGAPLRALWNPASCPADLLPWLAWSLSVDTWRPEWPDYVKRARLASAISIQRHKGTTKSVRDVVESFGGAVEIVEWWQTTPKGIPHTFDLTLTLSGNDGQQATAQFVDDVIAEVNKTKPVRSQFNFTQGVSLFGSVGVATYARAVVVARLELTGS